LPLEHTLQRFPRWQAKLRRSQTWQACQNYAGSS
jgi:hypothetical protein